MRAVVPEALNENTVSVIIPSYNNPEGTRAAINSIIDQTLPPLEIIVVDDASDCSPSIEYLANEITTAHEISIKVLRHKTNLGAAAARNTGVLEATGIYLAFLDCDDVWYPRKLELQIHRLNCADDMTACASGWHEIRHGKITKLARIPISSKNLSHFTSGCWFSPGSTLVIKRSDFERVGPFDVGFRRLEDYEWFLRFAIAGGKLEVVPRGCALISIGWRYGSTDLFQARRNIIKKHIGVLSNSNRKLLHSYMYQQLFVSHLKENKYLRCIFYAALSYLNAPRTRFHLERFWEYK